MPPFLYPLPTTSLLTFSNIFTDPSSSHTTHLADATSARTKLQMALKSIERQESGASALSVVDAIQGYLPYLRGIASCLEADELIFKTEPIFAWKSSLTHYTTSAPTLPLPSIHAEHLFVLLTYILALSNYAHAILEGLPKWEAAASTSSHLSKDDEKRTTAGLARAVDLLCQAAGIAEWTAENVCPLVDNVRMAISRIGKQKWPIEASSDTFRGLAMTLLADAHLTAIRKLLLPVLPHTLFAPPGPPLPSNHPSASLLTRLYLHVSSLYDSSRALFKISQDQPRKLWKSTSRDPEESEPVEGEIIPNIKRYLRKESLLATALAYKWLGVDAGENGKGQKVGEAVAWVLEAQSRLDEISDSKVREKMKGLGIGKLNDRKKEERKARKGRVDREIEDIAAWVRAYTRMNDTVAFQPVPPVASLTVPSGRPIFASKAFKPPPSRFAPSMAARNRTSEHSDDGEDLNPDKKAAGGIEEDTYAGKGNYF